MTNEVHFFLNGKPVSVTDPSPDLMLIDYLRSPEISLAGPKKGCGQGGCGACTVILSQWNAGLDKIEHRAINSCLRPVCALSGAVITTIEGTGAAKRPLPASLPHARNMGRHAIAFEDDPGPTIAAAQDGLARMREKARTVSRDAQRTVATNARGDTDEAHTACSPPDNMNPVSYALAMNNGTQCGYCSVGFVMNMSEFRVNNPHATKQEIEDAFDGNICRCTGYRAILTGMKTFASDWTPEDEAKRMPCLADDGCGYQVPGPVSIPFPPDAKGAAKPVTIDDGHVQWRTPTTVEAICSLLRDHPSARIVHGNTSYGVYKEEYTAADFLIDIRLVSELYGHETLSDSIAIGAGVDYTEAIAALEAGLEHFGHGATSRLGAAHFMARRTAGRIVRNAASIGGNTMLALKHIAVSDPFPSDLVTALDAIDASITYLRVTDGQRVTVTLHQLVNDVTKDPTVAQGIVLSRYTIPAGDADDITLAQKTALREINSHSIVNATTRLTVGTDTVIRNAVIVFGGIAPHPWRPVKTMALLTGEQVSLDAFETLARTLRAEIAETFDYWRDRMRSATYEGFTEAYKTDLAVSFLYKAIVNALSQRAPDRIPPGVDSSGEITWGRWGVSDGRQEFKAQPFKAPVSVPYIKLAAMYQASGQVRYTHEYETPPLTVNAAFVQSQRALAMFHFVSSETGAKASATELKAALAKRFPSFVDLITSEDVDLGRGQINLQGMGADQPLFAVDRVSYVGQSLALVLADSETDAIEIAAFVTDHCVGYDPVVWPGDWPARWKQPVIDLLEAIRIGSVFPDSPKQASFVSHIWRIVRPGSRLDWVNADEEPWNRASAVRDDAVDGVPCKIVTHAQQTGSQIHFYMETQSCVAEPAEGDRLIVRPSSQSPLAMHQSSCMALAAEYNQVEIRIRQLGGGYGGKTEQARFVAAPTALAAQIVKRPVRLVMPREEDTSMIGKRHAYYGKYQIAIDTGAVNKDDAGIIRGLQIRMWGDGGAFYDCSFVVSNCIQTRADNAYMVRNFDTQIDVCRTNKAPSTAFRSFGDIQGKVMQENAIDDAAFSIGMRPELVREKNMYHRGDVTPFGQALTYCYMREVWQYLKAKCNYQAQLDAVESFNKKNRWRKRGLAMCPVKYGSGYNLTLLEQATAVVSIYSGDGTIIIHQGGVDMGQGVKTKVEQVASYILNVPMHMIEIQGPNTAIIPNPTSTGGSTGTAYNGEAVKRTCEKMRARLTEFGYTMLKEYGEEWCKSQGIDFWNYGEAGWQAELASPPPGKAALIWQNLIQLAYSKRVSLVASFNAPIPGGTDPLPNVGYKPKSEQPKIPGVDNDYDTYMKDQEISGEFDAFVGFTYSAACSVVEVDILTGEVKILRSDIVFDMGWSLNPAIDVGQVEGAFVQGIGFLLTEDLVFQPDGPEEGRLNTVNTWRYKPPATTTIPLEMNVYLYPRDDAKNVPENPNGLLSSKEVGEPPLVLSNSVFFAVKDAIRASRVERDLPGLFRLDAPATVQEVRRACEVRDEDLKPTAHPDC